MSIETGDIISRVYGSFRGADFRGEEINLTRSPDCLNVWRDYKETDSIRTRPGMVLDTAFDDTVYGIYFYHGEMLVHSGTTLYKVKDGVKSVLYSNVNARESNGFIHENVFYFKDGKHYLNYDGDEITDVVGYIPTTSIGRKPEGGGSTYQDVNLLSNYRINTFLADGGTYERKKGNLYDGVMDEQGGIDGKTGENVEGQNWYRTSQYYPFSNEGTLYFNMSSDRTDAYIVLYDRYYQCKETFSRNYASVDVDYDGYFRITSVGNSGAGVYVGYQPFSGSYAQSSETETVTTGSTEYYLDVEDCDEIVEVKVDDKVVTNYTVDLAKAKITFSSPPMSPKTDGQDNVSIKFCNIPKDKDGNIVDTSAIIKNCTLLQVFDNRVFFSGNEDHPNVVYHSSLNAPNYCSDLDYYNEGMDLAKVRGMVAGNNALWVFREPSESNTNVFYHNPVTDDTYGKVYPSSHSSITIGCVGKAINFNDDIIFFSERGMEGISGDITTEQVAAHRSSLVDRKLIPDDSNLGDRKRVSDDYKNMVLEEWEGYLFVFIGNKVFLADSRAVFTNENHIEYEWFYWELEKKIKCAKVHDNILYLGTDDGVYTLTDMECDIESYWVTPKDKFKTPHKLKTTNKRGCVVEATGDVSVYAKIEDTGFELIGEYVGVEDYFVSRIKRKKWKDIQLKFYSKTRFSLETATLEAFVGGYIKR